MYVFEFQIRIGRTGPRTGRPAPHVRNGKMVAPGHPPRVPVRVRAVEVHPGEAPSARDQSQGDTALRQPDLAHVAARDADLRGRLEPSGLRRADRPPRPVDARLAGVDRGQRLRSVGASQVEGGGGEVEPDDGHGAHTHVDSSLDTSN